MELAHLRYFTAVAESSDFLRGFPPIHVAQPHQSNILDAGNRLVRIADRSVIRLRELGVRLLSGTGAQFSSRPRRNLPARSHSKSCGGTRRRSPYQTGLLGEVGQLGVGLFGSAPGLPTCLGARYHRRFPDVE